MIRRRGVPLPLQRIGPGVAFGIDPLSLSRVTPRVRGTGKRIGIGPVVVAIERRVRREWLAAVGAQDGGRQAAPPVQDSQYRVSPYAPSMAR
jgi:hypothetical protein